MRQKHENKIHTKLSGDGKRRAVTRKGKSS